MFCINVFGSCFSYPTIHRLLKKLDYSLNGIPQLYLFSSKNICSHPSVSVGDRYTSEIPKSTEAQGPYIKWHSICTPLYFTFNHLRYL